MPLTLTVLTPEQKVLEVENVDHVVVPTENGEIDVLPGHAALLATLQAGVLCHTVGARAGEKIALSYGIVEVADDNVKVFAETAETASQIDGARAQDAQKRAEEKLKKNLDPADIRKFQLKLFRALVRQSCCR